MAEFAVEVRKMIAAAPQRVYDAWLSPADWDSWFTHSSQIDARVGGNYSNGDHDAGTFLELAPPTTSAPGRIRFTWDNPSACPGTEVEITLTPTDGGTKLVLVHRKLAAPETGRGEMIDGWGWAVDNLAAYLEGRPTCDHDAWLAAKHGDAHGPG